MKVFIVDEEPEVADTLAKSLIARGVTARVVHSGELALGELRAESVDLALVDLAIPRLNAFEVIAQFKKLGTSLGLILVSGQTAPGKELRLKDLLIAGIARKESIARLLEIVEQNQDLRRDFLEALEQTPDVLKDLTRRIAGDREDVSSASGPPIAHGRRVEKTIRSDTGEWFRLEFVPCGSPRCRREPDEHGPYWYQYQRINTAWRSKYLGRSLPAMEPCNVDGLSNRISSLEGRALSDDEVREVRNLVAELTLLKSDQAKSLSSRAAVLLVREATRREKAVDARYTELSRKVSEGKPLTEEETRDLRGAATLLSEQH